MVKIMIDGETLDLPSGFSIDIEDSNPIFNENGSQSLPATVPLTRKNLMLLGAPNRIDTGFDPEKGDKRVTVIAGGYMRDGLMNVTEASAMDGITFNIGFDDSAAYVKWKDRKLSELSGLPVWKPAGQDGMAAIDEILEALRMIYMSPDPRPDDLAVFPVLIGREEVTEEVDGKETKKVYWEILNQLSADKDFHQPLKVKRVIDGEVTDVRVPEGYCVTPFLRVWRIVELIFADLDVELLSNPFKDDPDLARLTVLNNVADSVCRGKVDYSDLMPDCTVQEFLNALWVRFGATYHIDFNKGNVSMRLIKDIINSTPTPMPGTQSAPEKVTYEGKKYLKLSAQTGLEGATPACERWEDFAKNIDTSHIHAGCNVKNWDNKGTPQNPNWDGEVYDGLYDENYDPDSDYDWEPPEWWDDPRDDREYEDVYSRSSEVSQQTRADDTVISVSSAAFVSREFVSGKWYKLDAENSKTKETSTGFFNWDPQPEGLEALELSSDDECVPIDSVFNSGISGNVFTDRMPFYLVGARHYHTYIKNAGESENSGDSTPLAFVMALNTGGKTIGRVTPEGLTGKATLCDDNTRCTLSLQFQFADGLFARFWRDYDEILRHSARTVEVSVTINRNDLLYIDILKPVVFKSVRCLIETIEYSLPGGNEVAATFKLRPLQTIGVYDIATEQAIPEVLCAPFADE